VSQGVGLLNNLVALGDGAGPWPVHRGGLSGPQSGRVLERNWRGL
jgi:hypothetical protein